MKVNVIGIDCATDPKKTGISFGYYRNCEMVITNTIVSKDFTTMYRYLFDYINKNDDILIAMDAPFGWPSSMGHALINHNAGNPIHIDSNNMFRRETDRFIKRKIGKQSLDVGADRIARTAHSALNIIDEIRKHTNREVTLVWDETDIRGVNLIEVYPAATLDCYNIVSKGYKESNKYDVRKVIIEALSNHIIIETNRDMILHNADALDSVICLLAAKDFIMGNVLYPDNIELAKKEGWIWVKGKYK
mgnify:CR=1 FL=1